MVLLMLVVFGEEEDDAETGLQHATDGLGIVPTLVLLVTVLAVWATVCDADVVVLGTDEVTATDGIEGG